ncbi:hypothetical protein PP427_gp049 [Salmonella phage KM16]|nr:hypothetical protein PP427_gp049 [Salmonella phage KM16]
MNKNIYQIIKIWTISDKQMIMN